ncbi:hypothetical protein QL989_16165 [Pseudoalteromonas sp. APC 3224]|nr:hypothetical protein [Pseudoalteromonas sp. APC 3224]MDN3486874.1 hypothetical protein [Pseudoalteromonas sp. APC 3224]
MPLLLLFAAGGGVGFFAGSWTSNLLGNAAKLALVGGVGYVGYQMYKGGK